MKKATRTPDPARGGRAPLWAFTNRGDGSFVLPDPETISGLYFPLCNLAGMKTSVTPELKGDICADFQHYLTIPQVTEDFHRCNTSRNIWVTTPGERPWSATGVSAAQAAGRWQSDETAAVEAGIGWFSMRRENKPLGLRAETTVFVPAADDLVEVMLIAVTNTGRRTRRLTVTTATPIFGRTCDNLRDHRQVTTIFSRVTALPHGVAVCPHLRHDETGHTADTTRYLVLGFDAAGRRPRDIWANVRDFTGEGGALDNPAAVAKGLAAPRRQPEDLNGREAIGALRFAPTLVGPGRTVCFVVLHGIAHAPRAEARWVARYGTAGKAGLALARTTRFWRRLSGEVELKTPDPDLNNWMRWVAAQLVYRKVFGNSYLPDYDYGRGGRGWRDLWSDLLSLFLIDPQGARAQIVDNFGGVRVDGTNATIVGSRPGEFRADRNNIPRVWSDHGAWPFFVLSFYMHQTGDYDILFKDVPYWKDAHVFRCRERDADWTRTQGCSQRTRAGGVYAGSLFEHALVQSLSSFYNVGRHGNILLEGADWNDTYDNARRLGESVCFTHWYAGNLREMAETLEWLRTARGVRTVPLLSELLHLLDRLPGGCPVDYRSPAAKQARLAEYMATVRHTVSGRRRAVPIRDLAADLRAKADALVAHLRKREWVTTRDGESFYNGHYDDRARRVHGDHPLGVRMDLTSQVNPTIFGTATTEQVAAICRAARRYLRHPRLGGLRLCTDYGELKLDFGRATAYTYGYKEHGSIWNQQNAMFMYGLYRRGFVPEALAIFRDMYALTMDSARSRVFPCIPSYFDKFGHGAYCYLTGSATWLLMAVLTQMFGLRGERGDLCIQPRLRKDQFGADGETGVAFNMFGRRLDVRIRNRHGLDWGRYRVTAVRINATVLPGASTPDQAVIVPRDEVLRLCTRRVNRVRIDLGR